jgi:hypothetical protein
MFLQLQADYASGNAAAQEYSEGLEKPFHVGFTPLCAECGCREDSDYHEVCQAEKLRRLAELTETE